MSEAFAVRVPAKWVLTGEHAVLRGAEAIAFPYPELSLILSYEPGGELRFSPSEAGPLVRHAFALAGAAAPAAGMLSIESTIPRGAGLGSSAAFSVAVASWIAARGEAGNGDARGPAGDGAGHVPALAKAIEDRLHGGSSSGMDVAAIVAGAPIRFRAGEGARPLAISALPRFTLHDTKLRAATSACIAKVAAFRARAGAAEAAAVDARMGEASRLALAGLGAGAVAGVSAGATAGARALVAEAIRLAQSCFASWDLAPPEARALIAELEARGALAAKLTGAGDGGMVVALWPE